MKIIEFRNESGLDFQDISCEEFRQYNLEGGRVLLIKEPLQLNVSASGGHRIFAADGMSYYINPREGWYMSWKAKEGKPNFVK